MQRTTENLQFVQSVHFGFIDSLKNNGKKYLLTFNNSCEKICFSKEFVDIAIAGRRHELITIHLKHNLFHQKKHGRDIKFQNTHVLPCKSPR